VQAASKEDPLDSDDEERNPFEILTSSNSATHNQKIVKESKEIKLITEQDIEEAKEIASNTLHMNAVDEYLCRKENLEPEYRFLPYKSTEINKKKSSESVALQNKTPKIRDNTAATPPVLEKGTVILSLRESIEVEFHQQLIMKDLLEKQAAERLAIKMKELKMAGLEMSAPPKIVPRASSSMTKYRLPPSEIDDDADDDGDLSHDSLSDDEDDDQFHV
jgi:hypothetical protein